MPKLAVHKAELDTKGFTVIGGVFSADETERIAAVISRADHSRAAFRKTTELFAIRQFLKELPETVPLLFNQKLSSIVRQLFGSNYFVVKSIYFDKPGESNWYVAYHQDLTVSVDRKTEIAGFGPWTVKQNQFAVQPPLEILQNIFTVRIHLDNTDEENGALRVIPNSHAKGILRPETIDWTTEKETICRVPKGGVMVMKPLLLHSSSRTTNNNRRRVVHIELSNQQLPISMEWAEKLELPEYTTTARSLQ
ncbi:MAG: phytanoyl-CoA dioxygenase family protein [Cytophagales bacterium]|jgi:ectoine hydroxylase-related dioxygenase (phytanoyl-CoA dioxygenase family)|nr:phytanoyl-CoA dioxygenase family protein [Cytophagales bacterium]